MTGYTINRLLPAATGVSYWKATRERISAYPRVLCMIIGCLLVSPIIIAGALGASWATAVLLTGAALAGFIAPELYTAERLWRRKMQIRSQFPNFLDLLKLYTASPGYEGFGKALTTISEALRGELGQDLREVTRVSRFVGQSRLLSELEARFPYPYCRDLVTTVRLERSFGGGIAPKIAILADEAQKSRLAHAKMVGARSSVGLLVPLLFFHFPVALLLFILPFAYSILQALGAN